MDELASAVIGGLQGQCLLMYCVFFLVKTLHLSQGSSGGLWWQTLFFVYLGTDAGAEQLQQQLNVAGKNIINVVDMGKTALLHSLQ